LIQDNLLVSGCWSIGRLVIGNLMKHPERKPARFFAG
jgi:hypothetical protein